MAGFTKKRTLDDAQSAQQQKKTKATPSTLPAPIASTAPEDVDFPRGGGTTFTPLEVKAIRAEAIKEADDELFKVGIMVSADTRVNFSTGLTSAIQEAKAQVYCRVFQDLEEPA